MKTVNLFDINETRQRTTRFPAAINPQLYTFKHKNNIFIYSPTAHCAARLTHREHTFLQQNKIIKDRLQARTRFEKLVNSFLYQKEATLADRGSVPEKRATAATFLGGIEAVSLIFTTMCNLRCKYCAVFGGEPTKLSLAYNNPNVTKRQIMDPELATYVLGKIKPKLLHIYGWGEPSMAFDKLKSVLDKVDTHSTKIRIDTNGVHFSKREEIIGYFMAKKAFLQLSFDGLPALNDRHRVFPNGGSSTAEVLKTIAEIKRYGKFGKSAIIRVTIAEGEEDSILDAVKYLDSIGVDFASFDPVEATGRAINSDVRPPNLDKMATNLVTAQAYAQGKGFRLLSSLLPILEHRSMEEYGCGYVGGGALGVGVDGEIYACVMPVLGLKIGSVVRTDRGHRLELSMPSVMHILASRNVKKLKNCETCPVKCGGGCAARVYDKHNTLEAEEATYVCDAKRLALKRHIISVLA